MKKRKVLIAGLLALALLSLFTFRSESNTKDAFDQVRIYIQNRHPNSQLKRAALLQYAEDFEASMKAVDSNKGVKEAIFKTLKSSDCLDVAFDYSGEEVTNLYAEIMSTFKRSQLGWKVDSLFYQYDPKRISYAGDPIPEKEVLKKACRFDVDEMEN